MGTTGIYTLSSFHSENAQINAKIVFDEGHPVFKGHFPGNPIVPGVIQVQIIKDLMEKEAGQKLALTEANNIKFLSIISPLNLPEIEVILQYSFNENQYMVRASFHAQESVFMKFTGVFRI